MSLLTRICLRSLPTLGIWLHAVSAEAVFELVIEEPFGTVTQSASDDNEPPWEVSVAPPQSGIGNIRGWAIADEGIDRIELWPNNSGPGKILPYGGKRDDVGRAYPNVLDSDSSGFSGTWNFANQWRAGEPIEFFLVVAYTKSGRQLVKEVRFDVLSFNSPFLKNEYRPRFTSDTKCFKAGDYLSRDYKERLIMCTDVSVLNEAEDDCDNVGFGGACDSGGNADTLYDLSFAWDVPSQQFKLQYLAESKSWEHPHIFRVEYAVRNEFFVIAGQAFRAKESCSVIDDHDKVSFMSDYKSCDAVIIRNSSTAESCDMWCTD